MWLNELLPANQGPCPALRPTTSDMKKVCRTAQIVGAVAPSDTSDTSDKKTCAGSRKTEKRVESSDGKKEFSTALSEDPGYVRHWEETPPMKEGAGGVVVPDYAAWCADYFQGCFACPDFLRDKVRFCRKWNRTFHGADVVDL